MERESLAVRCFRGARRLRFDAQWIKFAGPDWADRIMAAQVTDRLHCKQGRSIARWTLQADRQELVVYLKRHYRLSWWRALLATLWPEGIWSPALQEWAHLQWAHAQGLPVPKAAAAGEFIGPWGRLQSFLAVEELTGMIPLHQAVGLAANRLNAGDFKRWKRGLGLEMARIARELHRRRWFHKDLYLCHFYIPAVDTAMVPDWRGRVHVIDLHRLGHHPWVWRHWQIKDLAQFLYSSEIDGVSERDRLRFWRSYLGPTWRLRGGRWLRACILAKWQRYRQHNLRRRARLSA